MRRLLPCRPWAASHAPGAGSGLLRQLLRQLRPDRSQPQHTPARARSHRARHQMDAQPGEPLLRQAAPRPQSGILAMAVSLQLHGGEDAPRRRGAGRAQRRQHRAVRRDHRRRDPGLRLQTQRDHYAVRHPKGPGRQPSRRAHAERVRSLPKGDDWTRGQRDGILRAARYLGEASTTRETATSTRRSS